MAASKFDVVGWRAWYVGGQAYSSADTAWEALPRDGALIFVLYQRERKRRRIMAGVSLYWRDGDIYACDNAADALIPAGLPENCIKRGKWTTDAEYGTASEAARDAMESPTGEHLRF